MSRNPLAMSCFRSAAISLAPIASISRRARSVRRSSSGSIPSAANSSATPSGSGPDPSGLIACSRSVVSSSCPSAVIA